MIRLVSLGRGEPCLNPGHRRSPKITKASLPTREELAAVLDGLPPSPGNVRWLWRSKCRTFGILPIADARGTMHDYLVRKLSKVAWTATKLVTGQEVAYTVLVLTPPVCGCESFKRREGKEVCKHVRAIQDIVEADES